MRVTSRTAVTFAKKLEYLLTYFPACIGACKDFFILRYTNMDFISISGL